MDTRNVVFEWTDDNGMEWLITYTVPADSPETLTEEQAEDLMINNCPPYLPHYAKRNAS